MKRLGYLLFLIAIVLSQSAWSAATTSEPTVDPEYAKAKELIDRKDWPSAIKALETFTRANPANADGFNLLGYGLRNVKRYDEAMAAYEKALKLNSSHRGAHEYIGVAYIELGQLDKAKEHLDALDKICLLPCEEYSDLKKAYDEARKARRN
jgi:tetratricopeptide (TPR) repeat protein